MIPRDEAAFAARLWAINMIKKSTKGYATYKRYQYQRFNRQLNLILQKPLKDRTRRETKGVVNLAKQVDLYHDLNFLEEDFNELVLSALRPEVHDAGSVLYNYGDEG